MRNLPALFVVLVAGCGGGISTADCLAQMRSPDSSQRLHAVRALGEKQTDAAKVVPVLLEGLKDPDAFVRREAAHSLGKLGQPARAALPALVIALRDRKRDMRKAAADAIKKIDPEAAARAGVR